MKICNKCGATVEDNYIFCNKCGNKLDDTPQQPNPTINQPTQPQIQYVPVSTPAPEPPEKGYSVSFLISLNFEKETF